MAGAVARAWTFAPRRRRAAARRRDRAARPRALSFTTVLGARAAVHRRVRLRRPLPAVPAAGSTRSSASCCATCCRGSGARRPRATSASSSPRRRTLQGVVDRRSSSSPRVLLVATIEREINAIWGVARAALAGRGALFVYALGITVGPLLIGAAVYSTTWLIDAVGRAACRSRRTRCPASRRRSPWRSPRSRSRCSTRWCRRAGCRCAPRSTGGRVRRARVRGRQARLRPLRHAGADLPDRLRRARRAAAVPDLDLRLLGDRAGRRGGHGDADRRPAARRRAPSGSADARRHARALPNRARPRYISAVFASTESLHRVVHHSSGRLADLAADLASIIALALIFERLWSLRQSVVAPPGLVDRVLAEYRQARRRRRSSSRKTAAAGAARPHARRRARQRPQPAAGDEGGDRGGRPRRHARARALPDDARHDRRDGAAARASSAPSSA